MRMQQWRDAWARAAYAAEVLRKAMEEMGAPDSATKGLRPLVSGRETAWVDVGMIPASLAEKVAEVIRTSRDAAPEAGPSA
uniref:Uncharacterized protein n=1 Tax=Streptomyces sp. NBC_00003 TaxID=2903608 RepID=A0AAU2UZC8_9ACTN